MFPEWTDLEPGSPVRQGDVLIALTSEDDPWRQLLVVLTADCDLAKAKHGGAITCLPILTHSHYLLMFSFERVRDSIVDRIVDRLLKVHADAVGSVPGFPRISAARMRDWVAESNVDDVVETLELQGGADSEFKKLATHLKSLTGGTPSALGIAVRLLADAKFALGDSKTVEKSAASVASDLASSLKKLPGDALFLNEVSPEHAQGYVVYLRRVIEVNENVIVRTQARLPSDARYLRASRLRSPYVYALSQQFAAVFSAIGLPSAYETARDALITSLKTVET